jgi:hypothetical protein
MPPNWWLNCKARSVTSVEEFNDLVNNEYADKVIFIDFYMQHCPWCYYLMDDLNKIIDDMKTWYGPDSHIIIKVDGQKINHISKKYNVPSFPHLVAL